MAETQNAALVCPICKHTHSVPTVDVLDAGADKGQQEAFLDGSLFLFDCPDCGYRMELNYSFLYQDAAIRQYLYFSHEQPDGPDGFEQIVKNAGRFLDGPVKDGLLRIVYSMADLREKIRIFEHGLDDRIVEICKGFALSQFPSSDSCYISEIHYDAIGGKELLRVDCSDGTEQYVLDFPDMYDKMYEAYIGLFPPLRTGTFSCVDLEYAAAALRGLPPDGLSG